MKGSPKGKGKRPFGGYTPVEITISNQIVHSVALADNGKRIVGGGTRSKLRQWKIEDRAEVGPTMRRNGDILAIVVSNDGRWIVTGDRACKVTVWDANTHSQQLEVSEHSDQVWAVDVSADSIRFASGSNDCTVRIFELSSGAQLLSPLQHDYYVAGVKFSPNGNRIATATYQHNTVRVYDAHTGSNLFEIPVQVSSPNPCTPLAWSSDSQRLFAASSGQITYLDLSTSERSQCSTNTTDSHCCIATNGKFIACSSGRSVSFWDATSQIGRPIEHSTPVYCVSLSPDGKYLACGNGSKISIHDLSRVLPTSYFGALAGPSHLPPMNLSDLALESWLQSDLVMTQITLSEDISRALQTNYHALANRAVVRARLKQWSAALEDANMIQRSPIGHIAKSLALIGKGEHELGLQTFDLVFHDCDTKDIRFLLLAKAIHLFVSGKREEGISRVESLISAADDDTKSSYYQVLAYMYLVQRNYERAVETFECSKQLSPSLSCGRLETIYLIYGWRFDTLESMLWQRLCESLYASGRIKEVAETLKRMVESLKGGTKESAHGRILEEIITRSGEVTLLRWTGESSSCNSCLPASPSVYTKPAYSPPSQSESDMEARIAELKNEFSPTDAMLVYGRVTGLQPVRFVDFRLHLPCIVFPVKGLRHEQGVYSANVTTLGDVELTTADVLLVNEARKLVFVHPWIHDLCVPRRERVSVIEEEDADSDLGAGSMDRVDVGAASEMVYAPLHEEVAPPPSDVYTRTLELIDRLGQPFSALLLLRQLNGSYKRVAADCEIVIPGLGSKVPKDIRTEVLEIL